MACLRPSYCRRINRLVGAGHPAAAPDSRRRPELAPGLGRSGHADLLAAEISDKFWHGDRRFPSIP